jgi:hypothetical protein
MRWKPIAFWIAAAACVTSEVSAAEGLPKSTVFQQWIMRQTRFSFVGGRVANTSNAWMVGRYGQNSTNGAAREQLTINGNGGAGSLVYTYQRNSAPQADPQKDPIVEFGIDLTSDGRFVLRYSDKEHPQKYFNLTQVPGQPISLSLPPADKPIVVQAPTLWHLLIINAEDCRQQVVPALESLRSDWHVARTAQAAEDELVKMAAVSGKVDRRQWEAWVDQLGDPVYMKRDRADRNLREAGPAVLGYLNRLNMKQLDAEQKSRVRSIVRELTTASGEDTPERVASLLVSDPLVWLALLARPEEATRQAAVRQLSVLLHVPINVDPKAQPESQAKAREELRAQIEKSGGAGQ